MCVYVSCKQATLSRLALPSVGLSIAPRECERVWRNV